MRRMWPDPEQPGPGQESVWDYPRPPALETSNESIQVILGGVTIASTTTSWRVLETSHPPAYYLPADAFVEGALRPAAGGSFCEWKGQARYFDLVGGGALAQQAAWAYDAPTGAFGPIAGAVSLYPGRVDRVLVNDEVVEPQPGTFYGGWITSRVVGPFKGAPGSMGW